MDNSAAGMTSPDKFWKHRIWHLRAEHPDWGAPRITKELERLYQRDDEARKMGQPPPQRTVSRRLTEFDGMDPDDEQALYRFFRWPDAMENGLVPWEASPALLEMLARKHQSNTNRPTVAEAVWYWRVTIAAPNATVSERAGLAKLLSMKDTDRESSKPDERALAVRLFRAVEQLLAEWNLPTGGYDLQNELDNVQRMFGVIGERAHPAAQLDLWGWAGDTKKAEVRRVLRAPRPEGWPPAEEDGSAMEGEAKA